jgi:hypothetical protein
LFDYERIAADVAAANFNVRTWVQAVDAIARLNDMIGSGVIVPDLPEFGSTEKAGLNPKLLLALIAVILFSVGGFLVYKKVISPRFGGVS